MANLRETLWEAWSSPVGIEVVVSDKEAFKRRFYSERAKAREEGCYEFDCLQLITPPADVENKWWIVKHEQTSGEEAGGAGEEVPPAL